MGFAVIDLETTGFSPARGDRIVEVGVVLVDDTGLIEGEWTTLVNPQRDVGPTHVHGIRASDVTSAPLFGDLAPHLVSLLAGRSLVAHNQAFDLRFLRAELDRHGFDLPPAYAAVCTMLWARATFGAAKLGDVCAALDITHESAHAALGDARATAHVLSALISSVGHTRRWREHVTQAHFPLSSTQRDPLSTPGRDVTRPPGWRPSNSAKAPMAFVDTASLPLWERVSIPIDHSDAAASVYLDMLTRVLEDGLISTLEYSRLDAIAEVAHLDPERIASLHAAYLSAATAEALGDGVVSDAERRELAQIATILDLPTPELPQAAPPAPSPSIPATRQRDDARTAAAPTGSAFTLTPGARIVFTGTMSRSREEWTRAIAEAGFITGSVTKNCAVLVAEDPATQSGKAKTARNHGIPIVTEAEFTPVFEAFLARAC
ncbi:exonuclease domain-containing protein [Microbacterium sp.]|uniref:exonuclease domain-containing protein n=1 Tax=Microbacterium sp. TaxID=51671 RepID=UPI0039E36D1C